MKVSQIAGFLGSGKTTALMKIVDELMKRSQKIAIIVNDVGEINVDAKFIGSHGLKVKEIVGGCICCQISGSFAETLAVFHETFKPDIVIVEPSGVAIPWGLERVIEFSGTNKDLVIERAPIITLVDATRIDILLRTVRRLLETQIREADVCFVNKIDVADRVKIKKSEDLIRSINPNAEIAYMSSETGDGISYACDVIERYVSSGYDGSESVILGKQYGWDNDLQ